MARLEDVASPGNTSYDLESLGFVAVQDRVAIRVWELPKIRGTLFGAFIIRILIIPVS